MRISDWSSDVCSSDLRWRVRRRSRASILSGDKKVPERSRKSRERLGWRTHQQSRRLRLFPTIPVWPRFNFSPRRSEEHTSELQSLMRISYAVLCLKKKIKLRSTELSCHY